MGVEDKEWEPKSMLAVRWRRCRPIGVNTAPIRGGRGCERLLQLVHLQGAGAAAWRMRSERTFSEVAQHGPPVLCNFAEEETEPQDDG